MTKENKENILDKKLEELVTPRNMWTPVDKALFARKNLFNDYQRVKKANFEAIKYSFKHHYKNNSLYHHLCEREEVGPDDIRTMDDMTEIPLIPDTFFKDYPDGIEFVEWLENISTGKMPNPAFKNDDPSHDEVIDAFEKEGVNIMFTSGTSGRFSFIPRDTISWNRLMYNFIKAIPELMQYDPEDHVVILTPDPRLTHLAIASYFGAAFHMYDPSKIHISLEGTKVTTQFLRIQSGNVHGLAEKLKSKIAGVLGSIKQKKSDLEVIDLLEKFEEENKKVAHRRPSVLA